MTAELEIKLHKAVLPFELDGRKTVPSISLDDKGFTYTPSIKTNIAETWKRAVDAMGERTREKTLCQQ